MSVLALPKLIIFGQPSRYVNFPLHLSRIDSKICNSKRLKRHTNCKLCICPDLQFEYLLSAIITLVANPNQGMWTYIRVANGTFSVTFFT